MKFYSNISFHDLKKKCEEQFKLIQEQMKGSLSTSKRSSPIKDSYNSNRSKSVNRSQTSMYSTQTMPYHVSRNMANKNPFGSNAVRSALNENQNNANINQVRSAFSNNPNLNSYNKTKSTSEKDTAESSPFDFDYDIE